LELEQIKQTTRATHDQEVALSRDVNLTTFYQEVLLQFLDPYAVSSSRQWLDKDLVLSLKGLATLAHTPDFHKVANSLGKVARGVHFACPQGSVSLQRAIARALAHSTGSQLVQVDRHALEGVRRQALSKGVPKHLVSRTQILTALFDLADEDEGGEPYIIVLGDIESYGGGPSEKDNHIPSALSSPGCINILAEELRRQSSRTFFILTSKPTQPEEFFSGTPGSSKVTGSSAPKSATGSVPPDLSKGMPFFPGMPPGAIVGPTRAFQVVFRNGTATMIPLNPPPGGAGSEGGGSFPPFPFPPPGHMPFPPPEIMQRIIADQQRQLQGQGVGDREEEGPSSEGSGSGTPNLPPDMTEEDLQELIRDPENQAMIKVR